MSGDQHRQPDSLSLCIPVYNGASTLEETLQSVLVQTRQPDEIVVVDDGSEDASLAVVRRMVPDARIIEFETNRGAPAAWNAAVDASTKCWVKLLCQDDVLMPGALEHQLEIASSMPPSGVMVASRRRIVDEDGGVISAERGLGRLRGQQLGSDVLDEILRLGANILGEPSAVLFRSDSFRKTTGFSPAASFTIDLDMWTRLARLGSIYCDPRAVCDFRVSARQWSVRLANRQADEMSALLAGLASDDTPRRVRATAELRNRLDVRKRRALYWWLRIRPRRSVQSRRDETS
jgi:glycosyltransferase involved in cell wall biosynthesis